MAPKINQDASRADEWLYVENDLWRGETMLHDIPLTKIYPFFGVTKEYRASQKCWRSVASWYNLNLNFSTPKLWSHDQNLIQPIRYELGRVFKVSQRSPPQPGNIAKRKNWAWTRTNRESRPGHFLTHKTLEQCSETVMETLDFQKLIEHTVINHPSSSPAQCGVENGQGQSSRQRSSVKIISHGDYCLMSS